MYDQAAAKLDNYALDTNHRSDGDLVKALHTLWSGASDPFLGANIPYVEVSAWHEGRRVDAMPTVDDRERRPLELRWFDGRLLGGTATDFPSKGAVSPSVAELCALECRALLESEATIQLDEKKPARRLRASDIAVLVRYHMEGDAVRRALARHGIPAIKTNREGVLGSPVTAWVLAWLEAVAAPGVERFARVLALSPLCGWSPARLARALTEPTGEKDDPNLEHHRAWERLLGHIGTWAHNWPTQGFARVFDQALDQYDALPRLLQGDQGERLATDLRHLFELLHQEQKRSHAGPKTLAEWLRTQQVEQVDEDSDRAQRLESDAAAVKIETIHGSKGLQYPVVMVPFCWTIKDRDSRKRATRYSRPLGSDKTELVLDLHSSDSEEGKKARKKSKEEDEQEDMRLLYVAMTRAKHHLVVWAGAVKGAERSPIGRLLFSREGEQELVEIDPSMPKSRAKKAIADWEARRAAGPEMAEARIVALCEDSQDGIGWSLCLPPEHREKPWEPEEEEGLLDHLDDPVVPWNKERRLGTNWLLTSYSGLSHGKANHADEPSARRAALPEEQPEAERGDSATVVPRIPDFERGSSVDALLEAAPGYDLPGGTGTGDWLHDVFEKLVFTGGGTTAKDGRKVADLVRDLGQRHGVRDDKLHQRVLALLPGWLSTPLDSPFPSGPGIEPGLSLGALHLDQRLDELRFDLRLGVGEAWEPRMRDQKPDFTGRIHPRGVRAALDAALEDPDFGGRTWLEQLLKNADEKKDDHGNPKRILPAIAGLLIGFIDLCFRDSRGRYFVLDYKSNALRGPEAVQAWHRSQPIPQAFKRRPSLRRAHYTGEMMAWGMSHHAYHLQALIYTVALHRLLRQRLDDYAYDTHIGGHLYLFLRGMEGKDTPRLPDPAGPRLGVWADRWPARTVWGLDAALDGADEAEVKRVMDANAGGAS